MRTGFPFIGLLFFFLLSGCVSPSNSPSEDFSLSPRVCIHESCFVVEVAQTPEARAQGLMFRSSLDSNAGMLFVFEEDSLHGFWMKNTRIPLDMIWIDATHHVVDIQSAYPCENDPCLVYTPLGPSRFVLEIGYGLAQKRGIRIGSEVTLEGIDSV